MSFRESLSKFWGNAQQLLFPYLEKDIGPLSNKYKQLVAIFELIRIEEFIPCTRLNFGRPIRYRLQVARAFIAKAVLNITFTKQLVQLLKKDSQLRVICGWDVYNTIPSESLFSRAFKEFAKTALPDRVHQALISTVYKDMIVGHATKDSLPLVVREKTPKRRMSRKERKKLIDKKLLKEKKEGTSRKQKQLNQSFEEMIEELPKSCDIGIKQGTMGYKFIWKGYKLHSLVDDHCIPLACILTSASLNDSEVAIPLADKGNRVAKNFYDLMDSAYDVEEVKKHSYSLGHVPIIDKHSRSKKQKEEKEQERKRRRLLNFYPAEDKRYKERFSKERFNAQFKDYYGGKNIFYRGHSKVFCHAMFGVLSLAASMILSL
jgi:hypothetical protein